MPAAPRLKRTKDNSKNAIRAPQRYPPHSVSLPYSLSASVILIDALLAAKAIRSYCGAICAIR